VDTNSLNGTYLNCQPVNSATLANGDEIQIGNFGLLFFTSTATS
jgi:pSer/pThr/pTyr-binding forkhead associated (FHA) protein